MSSVVITFDVPDVVVPLPLGGDPAEPDSAVGAVRAALPDAPDDVVLHLAQVGAHAARAMARSNPLFAGTALTRVDDGRPHLTTSQIVVSTSPCSAPARPDPELTVQVLRRRFGPGNVEPLATPLGPGFVVVADQPYRSSVGPLGEPGPVEGTVRVVQVQIPVPDLHLVLVLTLSTCFPADIDVHTALLATVVGSLRTTAAGGPPSSISAVLAGREPDPHQSSRRYP